MIRVRKKDKASSSFFSSSSVIMSSSAESASLGLAWNPKHLEIKTRSVERTLEPLVMQVRTVIDDTPEVVSTPSQDITVRVLS